MRFSEWLSHKRISRIHDNAREVLNRHVLSDIKFYNCDDNIYRIVKFLKNKRIPEPVADLVIIEWGNFLKHRRRENIRMCSIANTQSCQGESRARHEDNQNEEENENVQS